jgi:ATP-binding cassette, subfamily C, bacterial LapB
VLALVVLGSAALDGLLKLGRSALLASAAARYEHRVGLDCLDAVLASDQVAFARHSRGSYLNRFGAIDRLREHHFGSGLVLLLEVPFAIVFLALIWLVAGRMVLVPLALVAAFILISLGAEKRLNRCLERQEGLRRARSDFLLECIEGMHTLKSMPAEAPMQRRYERLMRQSAHAVFDTGDLQGWVQALGSWFSQLVMVSFVALGSVLVVNGELTVGALAAGTLLAGRVLEPALKGLRLLTSRQTARFAARELAGLLDLAPEPLHANRTQTVLTGRLIVRGLRFTYPGASSPLLDGIDLDIKPGEMIGISGANGSGKSTLLNLLMGYMPPDAGRIAFDGEDLTALGRHTLRSQVALVPQDSLLFAGTLLDNLTFFREGRAVSEALHYARMLGLDQHFARLPEGMETRLSGLADTVPLGLRQRITLVRALVGKPSLVLFDEANAGFDAANDERLAELFRSLRPATACLIVTQRPSLLRQCDRVFELTNGRLVERSPDTPMTTLRTVQNRPERSLALVN